MKRSIVAAVFAFALSCNHGAPVATTAGISASPTDEAFVRTFLQTWLVERDMARARGYLADDFFIHPAMKSSLPDRDRALTFAHDCPNAPRSCAALADCIRGDFKLETQTVDDAAIGTNPELRSRKGRELVAVSFRLKGCNLGALVLMDKDAPDQRRVLTILYLAG